MLLLIAVIAHLRPRLISLRYQCSSLSECTHTRHAAVLQNSIMLGKKDHLPLCKYSVITSNMPTVLPCCSKGSSALVCVVVRACVQEKKR